MRLPLLPPTSLSPDQADLYDDMVAVIEKNFGDLVARRKDGALIGPFNAWLHFPQFGKPAWAFNRAMWEHSVLPAAIHQLVILGPDDRLSEVPRVDPSLATEGGEGDPD